MQITSGSVQSQSQHRFEHNEQSVSVRSTQTLPSAQPPQSAATGQPQSAHYHRSRTLEQLLSFDPKDPSNLYGGHVSLLKALVEAMVGHSIDTADVSMQANGDGQATDTTASAAATAAATTNPAPTAAPPLQRTVSANLTQVQESELTEVSFQGQFTTADGQAISLDLHYQLQRDYSATTLNASVSTGAMHDPLILNFDGNGVQLTPGQTQFDLDSDGQVESIPTLAAGSAYLALDSDGNGTIDRGNELFGPATNNGYAELAKYDSDGNGFIDSGDPIFGQLRLFRPGATLQTLADRDVGAIFLGSAASPARLTDANNQSLGQLRATGFYLTNSGGAGLVQELDLTA